MRTSLVFCCLLLAGSLQWKEISVAAEGQSETPVNIVELAKSTNRQDQSCRKYSNASLPELRRARVSFTTFWKPDTVATADTVEIRIPAAKQATVSSSVQPEERKNDTSRDRDRDRERENKKQRSRASRRRGSSRAVDRARKEVGQSKPSPLLWGPPKLAPRAKTGK